jgi:hypothetical protein
MISGRGRRLRERKERYSCLLIGKGAGANPNGNLLMLFSLNAFSMQFSMVQYLVQQLFASLFQVFDDFSANSKAHIGWRSHKNVPLLLHLLYRIFFF